jgi:hypothetical protein
MIAKESKTVLVHAMKAYGGE